MNSVRQIKWLHLFIVVIVFLYISSCAVTAQIKRTPQSGDPEQEWYFCTIQSRNNEMSVNNYVEMTYLREEDNWYKYYILYNYDGYYLFFSPERSELILDNFAEDTQSQDNDVKKYDNSGYSFEFGNGAIEIPVHDNLSLSINCNVGMSPSLSRSETESRSWKLSYFFDSHVENECPVEDNRNQLYPVEEVFSLDDTLGEYPDTFQIPMSLEYGERFDDYMGVVAYGNRKSGGQYQCTELVHRFFRTVYNVPTRIGLGLGNGKDLSFYLTEFSNTHNPTIQMGPEEEIQLKFVFFDNGCSSQLPTPGSSISFSWADNDEYGHVAIVRRVEVLSDEMVLLHLFQQRGFSSRIQDSRYLLVKDHNGFWRGKSVKGWSVPVIQ